MQRFVKRFDCAFFVVAWPVDGGGNCGAICEQPQRTSNVVKVVEAFVESFALLRLHCLC